MSNDTQQNIFKVVLILIGMLQGAWMYILSGMDGQIKYLNTQVMELRQYGTETYARKDDMSKMEERIIDAINKLGDRIDK